MINVVSNILGPRTSRSSIEELTLNQVWTIIFGVDFANEDLKDERLNTLSTISRYKFRDFYEDFVEKSELFIDESYVHSNPYKSRKLILNGDNFYWIPLEDLPGTTNK